jgi:glycosyltransferase involved in cell wall biosynthesis
MHNYKFSFPNYIRPRVHAFSNPVFPQKLLATPADNTSRRKVILNINGSKRNKNLITLVKAFSRLASHFREWDIKVVGKLSKDKEAHIVEIKRFIQDNNLQDRILFEGPKDDIISEYATAHIHVISSLSEGCPTVVLEAMSVGLPSVGYADCSGTNELICHESNGLLAEPEDRVGGLEAALHRMMSSSELRSQLGRQALLDSKAFDPKRIYDQWEQLFFEAAEYKNDPERLFQEQLAIEPERTMHARRMRNKLVQHIKG